MIEALAHFIFIYYMCYKWETLQKASLNFYGWNLNHSS